MRILTPARNMSACVPLPVPRVQAAIEMYRSWWQPDEVVIEVRCGTAVRLDWRKDSDILRYFGPRRPR